MHRSKTNWLKYIFIVPFIWTSTSNSEENTAELKKFTTNITDHYLQKILPDINIPEKYKEALPENFHLRGFNKLTYDIKKEVKGDKK